MKLDNRENRVKLRALLWIPSIYVSIHEFIEKDGTERVTRDENRERSRHFLHGTDENGLTSFFPYSYYSMPWVLGKVFLQLQTCHKGNLHTAKADMPIWETLCIRDNFGLFRHRGALDFLKLFFKINKIFRLKLILNCK